MENIKETYNYCYGDRFDIEDLEARNLYINCPIDEDVIESAVYHILRYNKLDKGLPKSERKPIKVYLNSPGGSVVDGYGLIDAILASETPVYTINQAACFSMALLIFMAGHKRYSMEHSEFLLHDGASGGFDSSSKMQDRMKFESEQVEKMTKDFVVGHSKISESVYDANLRREWYFLSKEGKELGVVDYIIGIDCALSDVI